MAKEKAKSKASKAAPKAKKAANRKQPSAGKIVKTTRGTTRLTAITRTFNITGKSVTVQGIFSNSANNNVMLDIYRSNPDNYDLSRSFSDSFKQVADQMVSGRGYHIDLAVTNTGTFDLTITGDFNNSPIKDEVTENFKHLTYVVVIN